MRTTLTIDDHLAADLKKAALESNKSFKELVNETLRAGLRAREKPPRKSYRLRPVSLGLQRPGVDLLEQRQRLGFPLGGETDGGGEDAG